MREIDITKQKVNCIGDLYIEINCINVQYELWLDTDKYFGTNIRENDSAWINFYTYWKPDGSICAVYEIDTDTDATSYDWKLTDEEKLFFLNKMEEYCQSKEGKTLKELWNEFQKNSV